MANSKEIGVKKKYKLLIPVIAVLLGFLVGIVILLASGKNPADMFASILRGVTGINLEKWGTDKVFSSRNIGSFLVASSPIILTGLSVAFAYRTGMFNIGAEGQVIMGSLGATLAALLIPVNGFIHLVIVVICGTLAGAIWGWVPGILKAKFNVHEVVVTIMLNYIALHLSNLLVRLTPGYANNRTPNFPDSALLKSEFLSGLTSNSRLHWGIVLVVLAVISFWFIIEKTSFGYELKAVGYNKHAAKYAGMKVNRNSALSMMIAGAYAGLAGTVVTIGTFGYGRLITSFENYGFDGIAVALVGSNTGIGSLLAGLLFGGLNVSKPIMQNNGIPRDTAVIIISMIIMFVAMNNGIKIILNKLQKLKGDK